VDDSGIYAEQSLAGAMGMDVQELGSTEDDASASPGFDTNGLWLELTNVSGGLAYLNLHNATNQVYAIWGATNLLVGWNMETEVLPTDTNCMPFTVQTQDRQNLFLRAEDWTGVTQNGNTVPAWWFWYYFGTLALTDTNLDSNGNTLLYDYSNGIAPANVVNFTLRLGNGHFNVTSPTGSFLTVSGVPAYEAVLVNDTNLDDAVWQPYDGVVRLNLGPTDGVYQIWCGLKGYASAQPQWIGALIYLDRIAPELFLAGPTNSVTACPVLQVQGWSPEELSGVSFGLSNAAVVLTNQAGLLTDSWLDINTGAYTTNRFQCSDIWLTNGLNVVTLQATDLAGNVTTTNVSVTLDYSTATNPVIQLTWPTNGMQICQNAFTLRGWTEDSLAQIAVQIADAQGNTNDFNGMVERNGKLWVENIPLASGTNWLTLSVTNSAGLSSATNLMLVQSTMTLTLDSIDGDLWLPAVSVRGQVSDTTAAVWVNGAQGTNNGDGTWSAANVPVTPGGVASFDLRAAPAGGGQTDAGANQDKPAGIVMQSATGNYDGTQEAQTLHLLGNWGWSRDEGGSEHTEFHPGTNWNMADDTIATNLAILNTHLTGSDGTDTNVADNGQASFATEIGSISTNGYRTLPNGSNLLWTTASTTAKVKMVLLTGGKGSVGRQAVMAVHTSATDEVTGQAIAPDQITVAGKTLGADGWVYKQIKMGGDPVDVTPQANAQLYSFAGPDGGAYVPTILANRHDLGVETPEFCVGQQVTFTLSNLPACQQVVGHWTLPGKYVNEAWQATHWVDGDPPFGGHEEAYGSLNYRVNPDLLTNLSTQCWYVNKPGGNVRAAWNLQFSNGQQVDVVAKGTFSVYRPSIAEWDPVYLGQPQVVINGGALALGGGAAAGMNFKHYVQSAYSGAAGYTQLISGEFESDLSFPLDGYELDNTEWARGQSSISSGGSWSRNFVPFDDKPSADLANVNSSTAIDLSYKTYLRFMPDGDNNIFVTLRLVTWGVSASATRTGGVWTVDPGSSPSGPTDSDSDAPPIWTETFHNTGL
jgi:hypothetical protein